MGTPSPGDPINPAFSPSVIGDLCGFGLWPTSCFLFIGTLKAARTPMWILVSQWCRRNRRRPEIEMQTMSIDLHIAETSETRTSSRLRAWYLVQFRGYKVTQRREIPMVTKLGRLTYVCHWHLQPEAVPLARDPTDPLS